MNMMLVRPTVTQNQIQGSEVEFPESEITKLTKNVKSDLMCGQDNVDGNTYLLLDWFIYY